jgi:hypothetical protein
LAQNFLSAIYLASTIISINWWHALDKSNNLDATNQKLYARGFPKLERAYTLKREPNS